MREAGVARLVFSSTCAVYGEPETVPMRRGHPDRAGQRLRRLQARDRPHDRRRVPRARARRRVAALLQRRRRAAGRSARTTSPETHLIPLVLRAAAGVSDHVKVFGTDYPTPDGTAVRDYIHVEDLGRAHMLALDGASSPGRHAIYNLGTGARLLGQGGRRRPPGA